MKKTKTDIINEIISTAGDAPKEAVETPTDRLIQNKVEDCLMIFVSYDICNSTKMKESVSNWKDVITALYNTSAPRRSMNLWKCIGDEIVFCTKYIGIEELVKCIKFSYEKLEELENTLSQITKNDSGFKVELKGTIWLANISDSNKSKSVKINEMDEFIGKQIDEGFRMSNYSSSTKLLIDPKIVFVLLILFCIDAKQLSNDSEYSPFAEIFLENIKSSLISNFITKLKSLISDSENWEIRSEINKLVKNIYFVNYESLKGIWEESPYPIFWYFDSYKKIKYHEAINGGPISILYHQSKEYYNKDKEYEREQNRYYSRELFRLFSVVNIDDEINSIIEIVANEKFNSTATQLSNSGFAKLYYSIACIKEDKVLIVKRSYERKHLCGVWEFGFTKHTNISINDNIRNFFSEEFGISVTPITDGINNENIIPLHFCTTYRNNRKHNSILCCATIDDDMSIEELKKSILKHIENKNKEYERKNNPKQYIDVNFVDYGTALKKYKELSLADIIEDSYKAQIGDSIKHNSTNGGQAEAILYFQDSIRATLTFYEKWKELPEKNWCSYISGE